MTKIPNLFVIMNEKGISQKQLSEAINTSQGNISDWKSGRAAPTIDKLPLIADYLDVSLDHLLGRADNSAKPAFQLTPDEQELLELYRQLSTEQHSFIKNAIKGQLIVSGEQTYNKSFEITKGMSNMNRFNRIDELYETMSNYASQIHYEADQTYNLIFPEDYDFDKIKTALQTDKSIIEEAKMFYKEHFNVLMRDEIDNFFNECRKYIDSLTKLINSKSKKELSEARLNYISCYHNLINSIKDTILESFEPFA